MTELSTIAAPPTAQEAQRMTASWPDLLHSQIRTEAQAAEITAAVKRLSVPATRQWIAGRAATLLSQYFVSSIPEQMMTAIAEDWHEELKDYPAWAIQKAARWWMSAANEDRRKKPMPGDIAARAEVEMGVMRVAQSALRRFENGGPVWRPQGDDKPKPCSPEVAAEIVARAGYAPKRFGGDE